MVIHSTGALVVRNWIRLFSPKPSPIGNLVHLAGANFGSGLAHVAVGKLARWAQLIFKGVGRGVKVLSELEFGSSKTLDLHGHFLTPGNDMYDDYQVQEFCIIGSQTLRALRAVPIRYVKEDSADNTVRTAACNLNFNYVKAEPQSDAQRIHHTRLGQLLQSRRDNKRLNEVRYALDFRRLAATRREVPYTVLYETAHFGTDIGIVDGEKNRTRVLPHLIKALSTPPDEQAYDEVVGAFHRNTAKTQQRAAGLKRSVTEWNKQAQYEAHAQVIFRIRDQYGVDVREHDITFKSSASGAGTNRLEEMIEDVHKNNLNPGTTTFYLRTQAYHSKKKSFENLLEDCKGLDIEITGEEPDSDDISYLPLMVRLTKPNVSKMLQGFRTTVVDVTLLRLPSQGVFKLTRSQP